MWETYRKIVTVLVRCLAWAAGVGLVVMIVATCLDVVLRRFGHPIVGVVDLVQIAACLSGACALPYTTAVKGHVAVEYFFQKFPRRSRVWIDGCMRLMAILLFLFLAYRSWVYGSYLLRKEIGTLTLQIPLFWVLWLVSVTFLVVVLVKVYNLTHPGKEMMKP
ncbi:MAG: TRAP transporter small permease [Lentisphaerae bacterium]|jgi:TRAP-type C4-dicarboxylate transport system permease small subunit|nr:TRAP transporter small permease [Lentisphaerota bacterium]